jgi:hypothetical protein
MEWACWRNQSMFSPISLYLLRRICAYSTFLSSKTKSGSISSNMLEFDHKIKKMAFLSWKRSVYSLPLKLGWRKQLHRNVIIDMRDLACSCMKWVHRVWIKMLLVFHCPQTLDYMGKETIREDKIYAWEDSKTCSARKHAWRVSGDIKDVRCTKTWLKRGFHFGHNQRVTRGSRRVTEQTTRGLQG